MSELGHDHLTLVKATPAQVIESRRRSHAEWSRGFSVDQYLDVNAALDDCEHAGNKLTTWVLVKRSESESLDFLCSCETYRRTGLIRDSNGVQEVVAYAVASVFTPPVYRKRGYARHMLRLLHHILAPEHDLPPFPQVWGDRPPRVGFQDARFSVLYSDVGRKFYTTCGPSMSLPGWNVQGAYEAVWPVTASINNADACWRPLQFADLEQVLKRDAEVIRQEMSILKRNGHGLACSFTADNGLNNFLVQRTIAFAALESRHPPKVWGAALTVGGEDVALATWIVLAEQQPNSLVITRLRCSDKSSLSSLLHAANAVATEYNLKEIVAWGVPTGEVEAVVDLGGVIRGRTHHLPSVCVYPVDGSIGEVQWLNNEMFSWC